MREDKKLSYTKLEAELDKQYPGHRGLSAESLKNYEIGDPNHTKSRSNNKMNAESVRHLAEFYGVSTDYILGLTENQTPNTSVRAIAEYTGLSDMTVEELRFTSLMRTTTDNFSYLNEAISFVDLLLHSFSGFEPSLSLIDEFKQHNSAARSLYKEAEKNNSEITRKNAEKEYTTAQLCKYRLVQFFSDFIDRYFEQEQYLTDIERRKNLRTDIEDFFSKNFPDIKITL